MYVCVRVYTRCLKNKNRKKNCFSYFETAVDVQMEPLLLLDIHVLT